MVQASLIAHTFRVSPKEMKASIRKKVGTWVVTLKETLNLLLWQKVKNYLQIFQTSDTTVQ